MTYGQRFREIRRAKWKGKLPGLMARFGTSYPATIYNVERLWRVPTLEQIAKHAAALDCEPWELLQNVETEYDLARAIGSKPRDVARREWNALVDRYVESTRRKPPQPVKESRAATSARASFRLATAKRDRAKAGR